MTIKPLLPALFLALTVFIACDKSEDPEPQQETFAIPKIKTITGYFNGTATPAESYEYYPDGRIAKYSLGNDNKTFRYEPGKVIINVYDGESNSSTGDTILLNDKGLMIAIEDFNYEYNDAGYRITAPDFSSIPPWPVLTLKISNGNMVESTPKYWNEWVMITTTYKFGTDINTIGDDNLGITWTGKQNKNLMSEKFIKTVTPGRTYEQRYFYTYEFDAKKRVTKRTSSYEGKENYTLYTYY